MVEHDAEAIKTAFYDYHVAAGAKMVDFAGFNMPIQYQGITAEHLAVRGNVGLFDLSHMGEFVVRGEGALAFLQRVTTNNVAKLADGQIQYSCMTMPDGGIVDDLLVYRGVDRYLLVVNASNINKDFQWLQGHADDTVELLDISSQISLLAIQGPKAEELLQPLTDHELSSMAYYTWAQGKVAGCEIMFSRTGYTGEDGFELYITAEHTDELWRSIADRGKEFGMELIGLGARDTLRLEMKMALYGNDIDATTSPIEAGLGWIVDFDKEFIGRDVLLRQKEEKPTRRLVCLELEGKVFPRHGYDILVDGRTAGKVTSGTFSPSLKRPIALGYVPLSCSRPGAVVEVAIRDKKFPATVVKPPFYKNASHR